MFRITSPFLYSPIVSTEIVQQVIKGLTVHTTLRSITLNNLN